MEGTEKDHARSVWKASQRKKSRHQANKGQYDRVDDPKHLESNAARYLETEDEAEAGQYAKQSRGADMAALLEESLHIDSALMWLSRRHLDAEVEESLPPGTLEQAERALALDFSALATSLAQLPVHTLLGLEEELCEEFLPTKSAGEAQHIAPERRTRSSDDGAQPVAVDAVFDVSQLVRNGRVREEDGNCQQSQAGVSMREGNGAGSLLEELLTASGELTSRETKSPRRQFGCPAQNCAIRVGVMGAGDSSTDAARLVTSRGEDVELDELLGTCNADTPSHRDLKANLERQLVERMREADRRVPQQTVVKKEEPASEQDLEDWLNSL